MIEFKKRWCCEQVLAELRTIDDQWSRLSPEARVKVNGLLSNMASVGEKAIEVMEEDLAVHDRAAYLDDLRDPDTT